MKITLKPIAFAVLGALSLSATAGEEAGVEVAVADPAVAEVASVDAPAAEPSTPVAAVEPAEPAEEKGLEEEIQDIKQRTLELNRDLFILEEELLYPSNTQLAVFLSLDVGTFFALDSVKLTIDGEVVTHYLYTERQVAALGRGGVHRLYMGNLKSGEHEVVAVFTGKGPKGRDYRRGTELLIDKTTGAKHLELKITDSTAMSQPEFAVKEW